MKALLRSIFLKRMKKGAGTSISQLERVMGILINIILHQEISQTKRPRDFLLVSMATSHLHMPCDYNPDELYIDNSNQNLLCNFVMLFH